MHDHWIRHPLVLEGQTVSLLPLEEVHFDALFAAASDPVLWKLVPTDCSRRERFDSVYRFALAEREAGRQYPFIIFHKETQRIIGSTRFFDLYPGDRKLEIGFTWIEQAFWGSGVNAECKLALLTYCFETLLTVRVQFKTSCQNFRSRKAIEKIGAKFEGILRKDRIQEDGKTRNAAYYSILDEEWEEARRKIKGLLDELPST